MTPSPAPTHYELRRPPVHTTQIRLLPHSTSIAQKRQSQFGGPSSSPPPGGGGEGGARARFIQHVLGAGRAGGVACAEGAEAGKDGMERHRVSAVRFPVCGRREAGDGA